MNILFISYDSYKYDGRLRELIKVAQELGEVTFITRDEGEEPISGQHILYKGSGYLKFISFCAKQAKKMQDVTPFLSITGRESCRAIWQNV